MSSWADVIQIRIEDPKSEVEDYTLDLAESLQIAVDILTGKIPITGNCVELSDSLSLGVQHLLSEQGLDLKHETCDESKKKCTYALKFRK